MAQLKLDSEETYSEKWGEVSLKDSPLRQNGSKDGSVRLTVEDAGAQTGGKFSAWRDKVREQGFWKTLQQGVGWRVRAVWRPVIRLWRKVRRGLGWRLRAVWRTFVRANRKFRRFLTRSWRRLKRSSRVLRRFSNWLPVKKLRKWASRHSALVLGYTELRTWKKYLSGVEPRWKYLPLFLFKKKTDKNFFPRLKKSLESIPDSNGCRYYEPYKTRIGIVADEFLYDSIRDAAEFSVLHPGTWPEQIEEIDLLLVVSAWRGVDNDWVGITNPEYDTRNQLLGLIQGCKEKQIPTVFYSKEDPPNYQHFLIFAQQCEYIFTSCAEKVEDYRRDCPEAKKIRVLAFGINPVFHNPIGMHREGREEVIFSGSWMEKYPERQRQQTILMDGVLASGKKLRIIDRNYTRDPSRYRYPPQYWENLSPAIPHDDLQKLHRLYAWALDINTVTNSTTMFANRGYELQACGNVQISNYSVGVNAKLPFVFIATEKEEVARILRDTPAEEVYRRRIDGVRAMMTGETCFDRVGEILEIAGIPHSQPVRKVAVLADRDTPHIRQMFERQTYAEKYLFREDAVTYRELQGYDMVAFFSDDMEYEMFYLEDMINGFKYTACDYITRDAFREGEVFHQGTEHGYVRKMGNKYRTVFWRTAFSEDAILQMNGPCEMPNGYSIESLNYNASRPVPKEAGEAKISVVIPVYNNGRALMAKAFASLLRSSMFEQMEIILVDDGSTDGYTPDVVRYLERNYANVCTFFFEKGGSGSAVRPRNKGVGLARAEYLAFLDPENEIINDGYAAMYRAAVGSEEEGTSCDLVAGGWISCAGRAPQTRHSVPEDAGDQEKIFYRAAPAQCLPVDALSAAGLRAMLFRRAILPADTTCGPDTPAGEIQWLQEILSRAKAACVMTLPVCFDYAITA